jgi:hypothetical protein
VYVFFYLNEYFRSAAWEERREERNVLRLMTSLHVFVDDEASMTVTKLMEVSKNSRYKLNKIMDNLEKGGCVELVSQKPKAKSL